MSRFLHMQIARVKQFAGHVLPRRVLQMDGGAIFVMLVVVGFLFTLQTTQAFGVTDMINALLRGASWMLFSIANLFIALTVFCLRFFITLASYNNYIDVPIVKLGWAMVRDVANMFFVVALLVIAFATILGYEQYEWKRGMVKLVLMAIFINFSNLIAQLIIDVAHVFTITFLNAISATAGGNLINMFSLDKVTSMITGAEAWTSNEQAITVIFTASVFAVIYATIALVAIGSYLLVMSIRVVVLWVLIILSPLAYVLYAMPKGEKYAQEWWSEFSKHVIVAPIMVFFLWLSFATLGAGNIVTTIEAKIPQGHQLQDQSAYNSASMLEVSSWERMANFLVAVAFLMIGLRKTQETGAEGAGAVGAAANFGKKVATIATGYAAGRWLVGKGADAGMNYGKKKAKNLGMAVLGRASKPLQKFQRARNKVAIGLERETERRKKAGEKDNIGSKMGRFVLSNLIQTGGRADKKAKDWADSIERDKKRTEENYSTSQTAGGKTKLEATVRLQQDQARGQAKKAQKEKELAAELSRPDTLDEHGNVVQKQGDEDFKESMQQEATARVRADNADLSFERERIMKQVDYFRDEEGGNDPLKAALLEQKAQSLDFNKLVDVFKESGANANERANMSATLTGKMQDIIRRNGGTEVGLGQKDQDQLAMLRKRKAAITSYNAQQNAYDSEHAHNKSLQEVGWGEEMNDGNALRRFLSEQLGRVVQGNHDEVKRAWDTWVDSLGSTPNEQNAALRQVALNAKNQMGQYNETLAAIFEEAVDSSTGITNYNPIANMEDGSVAAKVDGDIRDWINAENIDVNKANSAAVNRTAAGDVAGVTADQAGRNAMLVKGKTAHGIGSIRGGMFGDLNKLRQGDAIEQLEAFAKALTDEEAFVKGIGGRMKDAIASAGIRDLNNFWSQHQ